MTIDEARASKTNPVPPVKKLTPGRRGEKRKRPLKQQLAEEEEKRRRAGKISSEGGLGAIAGSPNAAASTSKAPDTIAAKAGASIPAAGPSSGFPEIISVDDEDIFGNVNRIKDTGANPAAATKPRSAKKSECETKNKAVGSVSSQPVVKRLITFYSLSRSAFLQQWRLAVAVDITQSSRMSFPSRTRECRLPW
jgi:hypothetical protein